MKAAIQEMENALGTKVRIHREARRGRGKIEIEYYSQDDLDRIYDVIVRDRNPTSAVVRMSTSSRRISGSGSVAKSSLHTRFGCASGFRDARFGLQGLARAFDGVALFVQQVLNAEEQLDILAAVEAVAGAGLLRRQDGKLRLPVAQDVGLDAEQFAHLADFEVQLIRNLRDPAVATQYPSFSHS